MHGRLFGNYVRWYDCQDFTKLVLKGARHALHRVEFPGVMHYLWPAYDGWARVLPTPLSRIG